MPFQYPLFELSPTEVQHVQPLRKIVTEMLLKVPSSRKAEMALIKLIISDLTSRKKIENILKSKILLGALVFIKKELSKEYSGFMTKYLTQPENSTLFVEINKILNINDEPNLTGDKKIQQDKRKRELEQNLYNEFSVYFVKYDPLSQIRIKDENKRTLEDNALLGWMVTRSAQLTDFKLDIQKFNKECHDYNPHPLKKVPENELPEYLRDVSPDVSTKKMIKKLKFKDLADPAPFLGDPKLEFGYDIYFTKSAAPIDTQDAYTYMTSLPPVGKREAYKSSYILNKEGLHYIRLDGGVDYIPADKINAFPAFLLRLWNYCHNLPSFHLSNKAVKELITPYSGHKPEIDCKKIFEQHIRKQMDAYRDFEIYIAPLLAGEPEVKPWELKKMQEQIKEKMKDEPVARDLALKQAEQLAHSEGSWVKINVENDTKNDTKKAKLPSYWLPEKASKKVLKKMNESKINNKPFFHHSRVIKYSIKTNPPLKPASERVLNAQRMK